MMQKRTRSRLLYGMLLVVLVASGALFRLYRLGHAPYWMDEGYTIIATQSIEHGTGAHGYSVLPSGDRYWCPMYCYPSALIAKQFGTHGESRAASYRALAALAGILCILVIAAVARRMFGTGSALWVAGAVAFSYWQIAWSRQARWYTLFALFVWIAMYCFYRWWYREIDQKKEKDPIKKTRLWFLLGTILASIAAILTHALGYLLPFIFCVWYIGLSLWKVSSRTSWRMRLAHIVGAISVTAVIIVLFEFIPGLHIFAQLRSLIAVHNNFPFYIRFLWREYWFFMLFAVIALLSPFFAQKNSHQSHHTRHADTLHARFFLFFIFLAYFIPLAFFANRIEYRYLFHVLPAIILLGVVGMRDIAQWMTHKMLRSIFVIVCIVVFFVSGEGVWKPHSFYLLEADNPETMPGYDYYAYTPQPNWNGAYEFVHTHPIGNNDTIISSMPQFTQLFLGTPGYWIAYDYVGTGDAAAYIRNGREHYVGAIALTSLDEIKNLTAHTHGYLIFDYMAIDDKIPDDIVSYIISTFPEVYHDRTNSYSEVWVYQF